METREAFAERISELREEQGITQGELAAKLGISRQSVTLYENRSRIPDIEVLRRFAEYFDVTADYLLGLSDNRTYETAAIGDKLGLSDEVIERLAEATDLIKKTESKNLFDSMHEPSESRNFYRGSAKHALNAINTICLDTKLLVTIDMYLNAQVPSVLDRVSYGCYDFIDWGELSREEYEEEMSVIQAVNLCQIQRELDRLYRTIQERQNNECQEDTGRTKKED